jgi:glyoxylase-like metal-dependent hydrolase (beta-lactamase superfamily II)
MLFMKNILWIAVLFPFLSIAQERNFDNVVIEPVRVADRIYLLKGAGGNIGVLVGEDGVLMVDDQFAPLSEKIKKAIENLNRGKIKFLINTHIHGDHSGGNENFAKAGVFIVAHEGVRSRMMKEHVSGDKVEPPRPKEALPIITFQEGMTFHVNGEDIELFHYGRAHTDGDVIVFFKQSNVYHTGDVFVRYGYPYIDMTRGGTVKGFIAFLDELIERMDDSAKVIPGHGELATRKDVVAFRDKLKDMYDGVVAALSKGVKLEEIGNIDVAKKYDAEWGAGKGKDFVYMIAENHLKGN